MVASVSMNLYSDTPCIQQISIPAKYPVPHLFLIISENVRNTTIEQESFFSLTLLEYKLMNCFLNWPHSCILHLRIWISLSYIVSFSLVLWKDVMVTNWRKRQPQIFFDISHYFETSFVPFIHTIIRSDLSIYITFLL